MTTIKAPESGSSEHRFIAFDETPVFYRRFQAAGAAKGAAVIVHGMGEHGGRYSHVASYLADIGIECFVPDLRGFGKSGGRRAYVRRFDVYHEDLAALTQLAARETSDRVFLVGHSFGGLITSSFVAYRKPKIQGLALSSPIFGIAISVPSWRRVLGLVASRVWPTYAQGSGVDPATLTHDPVILEAYKRDSLIFHQITARLYTELDAMLRRRDAIASRIDCPTLLLQAGEDRVVSRPAALAFFDALRTQDKQLEVYEGLFHEIFNESERQKVLTRLGRWMLDKM